jgi:predicted DCC family thiol-disulfide oxidoreductase YuxK
MLVGVFGYQMRPTQSFAKTTIWYDGGCALCLREIALMRWLDKRRAIHFVDANAGLEVCPMERSILLSRLHASENGVIVSGAAAFAVMWRAIPLLRPLGLLARNRRVLAVLERLYLSFLKARPSIQRFMNAKPAP